MMTNVTMADAVLIIWQRERRIVLQDVQQIARRMSEVTSQISYPESDLASIVPPLPVAQDFQQAQRTEAQREWYRQQAAIGAQLFMKVLHDKAAYLHQVLRTLRLYNGQQIEVVDADWDAQRASTMLDHPTGHERYCRLIGVLTQQQMTLGQAISQLSSASNESLCAVISAEILSIFASIDRKILQF